MSERLQPEFDTIEYTFRQVCRLVQMAKRDAAFLANDHHFHEAIQQTDVLEGIADAYTAARLSFHRNARKVCYELVEFSTHLETIAQQIQTADLYALMSGFAELQPLMNEGSTSAETSRIEVEAAVLTTSWKCAHFNTQ